MSNYSVKCLFKSPKPRLLQILLLSMIINLLEQARYSPASTIKVKTSRHGHVTLIGEEGEGALCVIIERCNSFCYNSSDLHVHISRFVQSFIRLNQYHSLPRGALTVYQNPELLYIHVQFPICIPRMTMTNFISCLIVSRSRLMGYVLDTEHRKEHSRPIIIQNY